MPNNNDRPVRTSLDNGTTYIVPSSEYTGSGVDHTRAPANSDGSLYGIAASQYNTWTGMSAQVATTAVNSDQGNVTYRTGYTAPSAGIYQVSTSTTYEDEWSDPYEARIIAYEAEIKDLKATVEYLVGVLHDKGIIGE